MMAVCEPFIVRRLTAFHTLAVVRLSAPFSPVQNGGYAAQLAPAHLVGGGPLTLPLLLDGCHVVQACLRLDRLSSQECFIVVLGLFDDVP